MMMLKSSLYLKKAGLVVQWLRHVQLFVTPWTIAHQTPLSFTISWSLLRFVSVESVMPSDHLICHFLLFLPLIRVFSNEYSGLISFRIDWFDLAVQGTLKSLLQHHSSKTSIHQHSAFFIVQLSHPYMTTGKTIALTRHTFVGKVMLFNMPSSLAIAFLPRSRCLLI